MKFTLGSHGLLLAALLAVGLSWQALAQVAPGAPAQIVPFRATPAGTPAAGGTGAKGEAAGGPGGKAGAPSASGLTPTTAVSGMVWLQFINSDIATVARSLGAMTGRQVVVDTRVEGLITLQSSQAVTPLVAWDMFTQALQHKRFGITASQGLFIIAPLQAGAKPSGPAPSIKPDIADKPNAGGSGEKKKELSAQAPADEFEISIEWAKSAKPTLPNPTGATSAVRLPEDEPSSIWSLQTQDKTLYHSISRWAQMANWQLMWEAERDFPIQAQISIEGSFTAAIQLVMNSLASTDFPLQAVMNDATRVISIIRHQDPFAR
jgi:hypothetical protein